MKKDRDTWLSLFNFEPIQIENASYQLNDKLLENLSPTAEYWHSKGDPSTWLSVSLFRKIRRHHPAVNEKQQLEFTAHALGIDFDKVVSSIKWHDGYMTFKDGSPQETLKGKY